LPRARALWRAAAQFHHTRVTTYGWHHSHATNGISTKPSAELTLFDTLSRLTFLQAANALGADGTRLIGEGGTHDIDIDRQVELGADRFRASRSTRRR
jgi:hypothetical protein